jgi:hypothetical protein
MPKPAIVKVGSIVMGKEGHPTPSQFQFRFEGEGEVTLQPVGQTLAGWTFDELHVMAHGDPCREGVPCPFNWRAT